MATSTAARSIFRSCAASRSAARFAATESKAATAPRSSFRIPGPKQSSPARRCPVELSFCLESMLPHHSATATSLMTSLLFTRPYSWLSEAYNDDV